MGQLSKLFKKVLMVAYTQLEEETASYAFEVDGPILRIYFEWSNGETDWKNNFDFPAKPYRDMTDKWYCHRGFLKVWKAIEPHLEGAILNPDIKYIVIAGYSHGGAIAALCHEYCKFHRSDCYVFGYGFGAPRVVWGHLSDAVKARFYGFYVIRNKGDIVTHLPPVLFGFRHAGWMTKVGEAFRYGPIKAHYPDSYIAELDALDEEEDEDEEGG